MGEVSFPHLSAIKHVLINCESFSLYKIGWYFVRRLQL
jgi:hypothetical protein